MFDHNEPLDEARARNIRDALMEDIGVADWTALLTPAGQRVRVRIPIERVEQASGQLLRLAPQVHVLGPAPLLRAMRERLAAAARLYRLGRSD